MARRPAHHTSHRPPESRCWNLMFDVMPGELEGLGRSGVFMDGSTRRARQSW